MPESFSRLNLGAGASWRKPGWTTLDHKAGWAQHGAANAWRMGFPDGSFDIVFTSHMLEHIPHLRIDAVLRECNRVLRPGGGIRILCPDLEMLARAYVAGDEAAMRRFREEDATIRTDLGLGGQLMNFLVSPGADSLLLSRAGECVGGYAHVYAYDFTMLRLLLERHGFADVRRCGFLESRYPELREPLHAAGAPPEWRPVVEWWGRAEGITGFDRNPLTSLIVEAVKVAEDDDQAEGYGTPGARGLDPLDMSWRGVTRGYLHFTACTLKARAAGLGDATARMLAAAGSKRRAAGERLGMGVAALRRRLRLG
jgi:hypothetical protein